MKDSTNRNGLEITETVSVAGSVAGSVFAVFSQQLIYAAAPLSLALSLSLINRRRFEQALQENITAVSSEMGTRVTHVGQQLSAQMQSVRTSVETLSAVPIPAPFDPTNLEQQIEELKTALIHTKQITSQSATKQEIEDFDQKIKQLQACVSSLTEAFNQRSELQQIEQLSQTTTQLQQHVSALPPYFDTSDLKQEIQQIRAELQSLRQQVQSSTPPAETVNGGQTRLAHPKLNGKLARLPQLFKSFAQMQHQLVELQRLTAKSDRTTVPPQEQLSELSPITHRVASSNGTQLTTSLKNQRLSVEPLMAMAEARGIGKEFQMVIQAAKKHHLTLNPWPTNLMISPAAHLLCTARRNSSQCLFIISGQPAMDGKVRLWVSTHAIAEFYPVRQQTVTSLLGFDGWREMDKAQIEEFVASLNRLFEEASV